MSATAGSANGEQQEEEDVVSLSEQLKERDARIAHLESHKEMQDEQIQLLREEIGTAEVKHKEEIYWMRLEVDNLRREKEALEDRVTQVYRDLREEAETEEDPMETPSEYDPAYVRGLQAQVGKYIRTLGILDHQIIMVKSSCDEVVKSLKEEIGDVMEEKCRMEMDLLNQLSVLDSEKRDLEITFDQQIKYKNEQIAELKSGVAELKSDVAEMKAIGISTVTSVASTNVTTDGKADREEELLNEISDLKEAKKLLTDELEAERADADDAIARLEDANADLEQTIEELNSDLEVMRENAETAEAVEVLDALARDRQETLTNLERVAMVWEKADDSIQGLEDLMDDLRPSDETSVEGGRERLLSTLETASLVHGQIKVSLLLVELKLRNQLNSLKNDKLRMGRSGVALDDTNLTERMKEIQQEALAALDQVEESLTDQIKQLEEANGDEARQVQETLQQKTDELKDMQSQYRTLEEEIRKLRIKEEEEKRLRQKEEEARRLQEREAEEKQVSAEEKSVESSKAEIVVSKAALEKLQAEVLTVVERVKEKNETIGNLTTLIEEHKVRETTLKKELRRLMRHSRSTKDDENGVDSGKGRSRRSSAARPSR